MAQREPLQLPPRRNPLELEADDVAAEVALGGKPPSAEEMNQAVEHAQSTPSTPASDGPIREAVGARMGVDLSHIKMVTSSDPRVWAKVAFAQHDEIHFAPGAYRPDLPLGRALIAHELVHSAQIAKSTAQLHDEVHTSPAPAPGLELRFCNDSPTVPQTSTTGSGAAPSTSTTPTTTPPPPAVTGTTVRAKVDPHVTEYNLYDQIRVGLIEARKGSALGFHKKTTRARVDALATARSLSATVKTSLLADFDALLADAPPSKPKAWDASRATFLAAIAPSVAQKLEASGMTSGQQNQNFNWLQNVPASVFQVVLDCATANVPPALLYAAAVNEGMVDVYIRGQFASPAAQLTATQLSAVSVTLAVSGFQALGLDRYFEEIKEKKLPLSGYLPSGFVASNVTEESNVNEKGTTVKSAHVADLKTGLQVLAAILARRIDLFLAAATKLGFSAPTIEEKVFHGYVFYNSGAGEGGRTLTAHKPGGSDPRALVDWITKNEYANAQKVLRTYRFITSLGLLKGF